MQEEISVGTRDQELSGQVAIVTGGGRGIGRSISIALAAAGVSVALVGRSQVPLDEATSDIQSSGGRAVAIPADVTDRDAVERMAKSVEEHLGPIDLLVNNAGSSGVIGPVWEADPERWWHDVEVNLLGPFLCCRAVLPGMLSRRQGRIINLSSGSANHPSPYASSYSASKAALQRLTDSLAVSTRELGVQAFAISPGLVRTAMSGYRAASEEGRKWMPHFSTMRSEAWSSPDDAAQLCVYLASGRADALSGCFIRTSDDVEDMVRRAEQIQRDGLYTLHLRE